MSSVEKIESCGELSIDLNSHWNITRTAWTEMAGHQLLQYDQKWYGKDIKTQDFQ